MNDDDAPVNLFRRALGASGCLTGEEFISLFNEACVLAIGYNSSIYRKLEYQYGPRGIVRFSSSSDHPIRIDMVRRNGNSRCMTVLMNIHILLFGLKTPIHDGPFLANIRHCVSCNCNNGVQGAHSRRKRKDKKTCINPRHYTLCTSSLQDVGIDVDGLPENIDLNLIPITDNGFFILSEDQFTISKRPGVNLPLSSPTSSNSPAPSLSTLPTTDDDSGYDYEYNRRCFLLWEMPLLELLPREKYALF